MGVPGLAQRLVAAGLFNLGVSLESLDPAINEVIRPFPGGTAKTIRCIDLILADAGMPEGTREQLFVKDVDRLRRTMDRLRELKGRGYNVHVTEQHLHEFVKQYEDDPEHVSTMHEKISAWRTTPRTATSAPTTSGSSTGT